MRIAFVILTFEFFRLANGQLGDLQEVLLIGVDTLRPSSMVTALVTPSPTSPPTEIPMSLNDTVEIPILTLPPKESPQDTTTTIPVTPLPTPLPTFELSLLATPLPTEPPTALPTVPPTALPTTPPTILPTAPPTITPTVPKTLNPTRQPTMRPTRPPTRLPTRPPTRLPTRMPTQRPTRTPTTQRPTRTPTTLRPTRMPTTARPTVLPTASPTVSPTKTPTDRPTESPTERLTANPTPAPTTRPTPTPSLQLLPSSSPSDALDLTTPEGLIAAARIAITNVFLADRSLGYRMVRLGFHDCVGGCDGCVDLLNADNNGLGVVITALESVVASFAKDNVTRADIWCLSANVYADFAQGAERIEFPFKWYGRPTCEMQNAICRNSTGQEVPCTATRGPHRSLPSPDLDTHGVLEYFQNTFGFDTQETVAILGAHTLGQVERENSGFVGQAWDGNRGLLDNEYYIQLVGGESASDPVSVLVEDAPDWTRLAVDNSDLPNMPNRFQWELHSHVMLNADVALVRNFTGQIESNGNVTCAFRSTNACPAAVQTLGHAAVYRNNNLLWLEDFRDVFETMLNYPYITGAGCPGINMCYIATLPTAQGA